MGALSRGLRLLRFAVRSTDWNRHRLGRDGLHDLLLDHHNPAHDHDDLLVDHHNPAGDDRPSR